MQNSREKVKYSVSTRVMSHRQKSHTLEPTYIESYADTKDSKFLNIEEKKTEKTQEEIEWEIYEAGWNEGYQSGISDVETFTHAKAKMQKKKIPQAHTR